MNEFVIDTIDRVDGILAKLPELPDQAWEYRRFVVVSDEHEISYLLCGALFNLKFPASPQQGHQVHLILSKKPADETFRNELQRQWNDVFLWNSLEEYFHFASGQADGHELFFDIVNLRSSRYITGKSRIQKDAELRAILEHNQSRTGNLLQLITCIPSIEQTLPSVTNAIAEREYEVIFRDYPEDSLEKYVLHLENILRLYPDSKEKVQAIRLDRVFGPGITADDGAGVISVLRDIQSNGTVQLYDRDRHDIYSAVYIRDAVLQIILAALSGRSGNIYHVSGRVLSRFQVISTLYESLPDHEIYLETIHEGWDMSVPTIHRSLNAKKVQLAYRDNINSKLYVSRQNALLHTALWYFGVTGYIPRGAGNDVYYGRMGRIREIELTILRQVDAICKKHNIQYFLTAGTMLGAVRHHGFIPWDDDVDIGMLPEDYERFLKVAPENLDIELGYQNFSTELTSHYIHDKIRLKNSFFSTRYSNKYPMMNGVYIDIFVYYKTSNHPLMQKFHIKQISVMRRIIGIRWADRPRKKFHYHFSKVALPIMRRFPFIWLHRYYMHILKRYEKRNTHFRVDSMGFNLKKVGAFPAEWLDNVIECQFCGYTFPILERYDDFLRHWYGDHYMELLPVSKRKSVHSVVRIDLGQYLFDETKDDPSFRDADLRGELYEGAPGETILRE